MTVKLGGDARSEWQRHWTIVLAAMGGVGISTMMVYSIGLFIDPFEREFGWTRAQIAFGPTLSAVSGVLLSPFSGTAIDWFGPRRIGIAGVVGISGAVALLSLVGPNIWTWWAGWALLALVHLCIGPAVWTSAVSSVFAAGRGFALAVTMCGSGLASLITPVLTYELMIRFGWRLAFVGLAAIWAAIILPLVLLFFTSVKDRERISATSSAPARRAFRDGRNLLLRPRFMLLAGAGCLISAVVGSLVVSLVPVLSWAGLSRAQAVNTASVMGFSAIAGRLAIGVLLDQVEGRLLSAGCACLPICTSILLLAFPGSFPAAFAAVIILGLTFGAELDILAYMTSRYFDLRHFGLLFGVVAGLIGLGAGIGPLVISAIYDQSGSYFLALCAVMPMCLTASILFISLGPYCDNAPATRQSVNHAR